MRQTCISVQQGGPTAAQGREDTSAGAFREQQRLEQGGDRLQPGEGISGQFFGGSSALACCLFKRETKQFSSLAMFGYKHQLTQFNIYTRPGWLKS